MTDDDSAARDARRALGARERRGRLDGPRLACGADPDELVDQVADGRGEERTAHQRDCVYCRAALAEYGRLWRPIEAVAAHDPPAPESAVDEVFRRLRGVTDDPDHGHLDGPDGRVRISTRAVGSLAEELTRTVEGVRVALGKLVDLPADAPAPDPRAGLPDESGRVGVTAGLLGASAALQVVLAADYGTDLHALGERVRAAVAAGIRTYLELEPVYIEVVVDDVLP